MRKIPTLFHRSETDRSRVLPIVTPGCEWVLRGEGKATAKYDGTACLVLRGGLYKRYDAQRGKTPPGNFLPAQAEPDPETGHWPGWVPVLEGPEDAIHRAGYLAALDDHRACEWNATLPCLPDGTYELCGPKVQSNPHGFERPILVPHGVPILPAPPRDYDGLRDYLATYEGEGIVWWHEDGRRAKLKRRDFGFPWPLATEAPAP
jgi:hypothetical protein